nr:hypothetical protein Iba_chr02cCG10120 [Ipomoea batatas]
MNKEGDDRRGAVGGRYALTPDGLEGGHAGQSHVVVADLLMPDAYTVARCSTLLLTVRGLRSFLRKLKIEMKGLKHAHLHDDGSRGWSPEMVKEHALSSLLLVLTGDVATDYAPNQGPQRQPPWEADVRRWVRAPQALEGRDLVVEYRVRDSEDALGGEHEEL